jgi:GT2 family glycosyltransferase/glycosyltransferase involved in cell wall biosynthesis
MQPSKLTAPPQVKSTLTLGNRALRAGNYTAAIDYYLSALQAKPEISKLLTGNMEIAKKKYRAERDRAERQRVAVCGWELSHNSAGRVYTLAKVYETFADVEIIGSLFARYGRGIWEPIRNTTIPCHTIIVEEESRFLDQALALVAAHPYDIVHLSKPRISNIFFGLLYKLIWGAKVLIDIDDEELTFVGAQMPISLDDYLAANEKPPELKDLDGRDWTRIAVSLAKEFDGITVSNPALQQRYGGQLIRHARDEKLYQPSPELKHKSREKFGIPEDKKVVLFFSTPSEHKGLLETAKAIAQLERKDLLFVIVGNFTDPNLKNKLLAIQGVDYRFFGNQPFDSIPEVVAMGDICVILQDPESPVSQFQVPARLSDALGLGLVVIAQDLPALSDLLPSEAIALLKGMDIKKILLDLVEDQNAFDKISAHAKSLFYSNFSIIAAVKDLQFLIDNTTKSSAEKESCSFINLLKLTPPSFILNQIDTDFRESVKPIITNILSINIEIVIPVYNALIDLKLCLESVKLKTDGFIVKVYIVNDGSDSLTTDWLREYCKHDPMFTLIEHEKNLGYTFAVNSGLKVTSAPYVITLNSDTIVTKGWLTGLVRCINSAPEIGIVGPLSNAASWQNIPDLYDETKNFAVNELPVDVKPDEIANIISLVSLRLYPRLSFVNGFCFMIKQTVIQKIGYMDEETFPLGYGEENDFCVRASDAGFKLAIADDTYVYHAKSKSFGHERRKELSKNASNLLRKKHGEVKYDSLVTNVGKEAAALNSLRESVKAEIQKQFFDCNDDIFKFKDAKSKRLCKIDTVDMHGTQIRLMPPPTYGTKNYEVDPTIFGPCLILPFDGENRFIQPKQDFSIGVHLHLYYLDLVDEFVFFLKNIPFNFTLYISVVDDDCVNKIQQAFSQELKNAIVIVKYFENRGRDIAPFICGFGQALLEHDIICHIHSKRSLHNQNKADWRRQLLVNLLGSERVVGETLRLISENEHLGMIFPEYHHSLKGQISWGTNFSPCQTLADKLKIEINQDEMVIFPAGSMFWARRSAVVDLFQLGLNFSDFPKEDAQVDGTVAHSVERLLGEIVTHNGYEIIQTKSEKQHNLIFYYPHKWPYPWKMTSQEIKVSVVEYHKTKGQSKPKVVVYSALTGTYDQPVFHEKLDSRIDYVLFSDMPLNNKAFWDIRPMDYQHEKSVRKARFVKTNPHKYFSDYDIAIWIDANVLIKGDIWKYVEEALNHPEIPVFGVPHPHRNCLYAEAESVVQANKDGKDLVGVQIDRYKKEKYPYNNSLIETNLMVINIKHEKSKEIFNQWWHQIDTGSHRDQLSINYVLWKTGATWKPLFNEKISLRDSFDFAYLGHGRNSGYPVQLNVPGSKLVTFS